MEQYSPSVVSVAAPAIAGGVCGPALRNHRGGDTLAITKAKDAALSFGLFFGLQGTNFLLIVVNMRAAAHLQYTMAALTDFLICLLSWTLLKKITEAQGWSAKLGYAFGGTCGSLLAMWLTRVWG